MHIKVQNWSEEKACQWKKANSSFHRITASNDKQQGGLDSIGDLSI